ncbi:putative cytochrome P450 [Streptomyces sp. Tu6071]|uniref:cytochrome P450 n=1 Tax=unclassified Streptomyces TaxID=2593676 RepID=UPI00020E54BD|nr:MULTISPECIES: cytochrome P450 [unclassified Streptomyces]ASY31956.1 cytochrome [Streptomyces sp. CLI2509]EGJ73630.1 putative cytochrome P450 [Streptomyces sp. Tu6071]MYX19739.1 cytochrome P450 [Streptomyces sp. SID8380]
MTSHTQTRPHERETLFAPPLEALLRDHLGADLFRPEPDTVGVAGPALVDRILAARPAGKTERPTFKPLLGRAIPHQQAATQMQAIGHDVRAALKREAPRDPDLSGPWPHVGHVYLRDLILGGDPRRLRVLMNRALELTPKLTWTVIAAGAALPAPRRRTGTTRLGALSTGAATYQERRYAMGLYRRTAAPVCFTISTLVANALWLGAPFAAEVPSRHLVHESLRLLPPSWNILRNSSPEYPVIDARIAPADDVLVLPFLSHRDPALWENPEEFRPERWEELDPERVPGYLPFGHSSERCWGRHMVMPLAEMLLDMIRSSGLVVDPGQRTARVPLTGLMGVDQVRLVQP